MDESSIGAEWNSGETLVVTLVDQDLNKNTLDDEDMTLATHNSTIPALIIGSPITLSSTSKVMDATMSVSAFNKIATIQTPDSGYQGRQVTVNFTDTTVADYRTAQAAAKFVFINYDVSQIMGAVSHVTLVAGGGIASTDVGDVIVAAEATTLETGLLLLDNGISAASADITETGPLKVNFTNVGAYGAATGETLYVDIFTYGDRVNNAIYRLLLEETDDSTGIFIGEVEFTMLN
jgi:hypothetical protein